MENRPEDSSLLRQCVSSLQRSLNVTLEEHTRHILSARLNGIARLVCKNRVARRGEGGGGPIMPSRITGLYRSVVGISVM